MLLCMILAMTMMAVVILYIVGIVIYFFMGWFGVIAAGVFVLALGYLAFDNVRSSVTGR